MSEQDGITQIELESGTYDTRLTKKFLQRKVFEKQDPRVVKATIPGVIECVETAVGKAVRSGDMLIILEAMKMHNRIRAPQDGTVKVLCVAAGDKVVKGQVLLEIE